MNKKQIALLVSWIILYLAAIAILLAFGKWWPLPIIFSLSLFAYYRELRWLLQCLRTVKTERFHMSGSLAFGIRISWENWFFRHVEISIDYGQYGRSWQFTIPEKR